MPPCMKQNGMPVRWSTGWGCIPSFENCYWNLERTYAIMQICILGTAAAEGLPGLFCHCPCCERARALGGKNIRTQTSLVIDEAWMVDFPPDTYLHTLRGHMGVEPLIRLKERLVKEGMLKPEGQVVGRISRTTVACRMRS